MKLSQLIVSAVIYTSLALLVKVKAQLLDECLYRYWYVNTGALYGPAHPTTGEVTVACLDPRGCSSVLYAPEACDGCFDSGCTQLLEATHLAQGELFSWNVTDITDGIKAGDVICSDGQLSVSTTPDETLQHSYQWAPGSNAGTRFTYRQIRSRGVTSCLVFSFTDAQVTISASLETPMNYTLPAFDFTLRTGLNAHYRNIEFVSTAPVVVTCWNSEGHEFMHVWPVQPGTLFGWDSIGTVGVQVDCDTLAPRLSTLPTCRDTKGSPSTFIYSTEHFGISETPVAVEHYGGSPMRCSPGEAGSCIAISTAGDGGQFEATSWIREEQLATYFVFSAKSRLTAFAGTVPTPCKITFTDYSTVKVVEDGSDDIRGLYLDTAFSKGDIINCDSPVAIVSQYDITNLEEEYNFQGLEDETAWAAISHLFSACPSTTTITSSPTVEFSTTFSTSCTRTPCLSLYLVSLLYISWLTSFSLES